MANIPSSSIAAPTATSQSRPFSLVSCLVFFPTHTHTHTATAAPYIKDCREREGGSSGSSGLREQKTSAQTEGKKRTDNHEAVR